MKQSKLLILFLAGLILRDTLYALPREEKVVVGDISIERSENNITINQTSKRAILNWDSFSVEKGESVFVTSTSKDFSILNRVIGKSSSIIDGHISTEGKFILINPNGIVIGPNGIINAVSFIASTFDISNEKFLENDSKYFFGSSLASIENNGVIEKINDSVYLISKKIINNGRIEAKKKVCLVGSENVFLYEEKGDILIQISGDGSIVNDGQVQGEIAHLRAGGNNFGSFAINCKGEIVTKSERENKSFINIQADKGLIEIEGVIKTQLPNKGGNISISGEKIKILENSIIDASGHLSGGDILVEAKSFKNSEDIDYEADLFVKAGARVFADATTVGDGGNILFLSDGKTFFKGKVFARGGKSFGNGGFVEISGNDLIYKGEVDTSSFVGRYGKFLLDPSNIYITDKDLTQPSFDFDTNIYNPGPGEPTICYLYYKDIIDALNISNVEIKTTVGTGGDGDVKIFSFKKDPFTISWSSPTTFSILADRCIQISSDVTIENDFVGSSEWNAVDFKTLGNAEGEYHGIISQGKIFSKEGNIRLEGHGSSEETSTKVGIWLNGAKSEIASNGTGENAAHIFLAGYGGNNGDSNHGIYMSNAKIKSYEGKITLNGFGNGGESSNRNKGIFLYKGTIVGYDEKDETISFSADIEINGTGGKQKDINYGCHFANSEILCGDGSIKISGYSSGYGEDNYGVYLTQSSFQSYGKGKISFLGRHENKIATNNNRGFYAYDSTVNTALSDINIIGEGSGTNFNNSGIYIFKCNIKAFNDGNIFIKGRGDILNSGKYSNYGLSVFTTSIVAHNGQIDLEGISYSQSSLALNSNKGFLGIDNNILTTGSGSINICGKGGGGLNNYGIEIVDIICKSRGGNVTFVGIKGNDIEEKNDITILKENEAEKDTFISSEKLQPYLFETRNEEMLLIDPQIEQYPLLFSPLYPNVANAISQGLKISSSTLFAGESVRMKTNGISVDEKSSLTSSQLFIESINNRESLGLGYRRKYDVNIDINTLNKIFSSEIKSINIGEKGAGNIIVLSSGLSEPLQIQSDIAFHGDNIYLNESLNLGEKNCSFYIGEKSDGIFRVDKPIELEGQFTIYGGDYDDVITINVIDQKAVIDGGGGFNILQGPGYDKWYIKTNNTGILNNIIFKNIQNLRGSPSIVPNIEPTDDDMFYKKQDIFLTAEIDNNQKETLLLQDIIYSIDDDYIVFEDGATVEGIIDGGGGFNTIDLRAYTTPVYYSLEEGYCTGTGGIVNIQRVLANELYLLEDISKVVFTDQMLGMDEKNIRKILFDKYVIEHKTKFFPKINIFKEENFLNLTKQ